MQDPSSDLSTGAQEDGADASAHPQQPAHGGMEHDLDVGVKQQKRAAEAAMQLVSPLKYPL